MGRENDPFQRRSHFQDRKKRKGDNEYEVYKEDFEVYDEDFEYEDVDEYEVGDVGEVYERGSKTPRRSGTPLPPSSSTTRNVYPRTSRTRRMPESTTPGRPPMRPMQQGRGQRPVPPLQRQDDFSAEPGPPSRRFRESQPLSRRPTGPQPQPRHPTGPQPSPRHPTGPQQPSRHPTGPQSPSRRLTGPQQPSRHPTGPQQRPSRQTRRIDDDPEEPEVTEPVLTKPRKRRVWPIFLIGCAAGAVSLVLAATIIVLISIHRLQSDLNLPGTGPSIAGKPEVQTVPLSALSQLLVCDAAGDISLGIDPNANATSATVTTTKIALNSTDQNDANQKLSQVVVSVEGQSASPSQQPLACPTASASTTPPSNVAPTAAPTATNSSYTGLSVNVSFPPNQANNMTKVNIAILLPQLVVQAQQASTNAVPTLFVQDDVGNINIDAGNLNAIMNISGLSGDITVKNAILVDGSHLNAGGKLTFNGFISQIATPPNKQPSLRFDGTSLIDLTLPESSPVIIDATVDARAATITSDFRITVVDASSGYHTYDGPFNPDIATDETTPTLHMISSSGNIALHKK